MTTSAAPPIKNKRLLLFLIKYIVSWQIDQRSTIISITKKRVDLGSREAMR